MDVGGLNANAHSINIDKGSLFDQIGQKPRAQQKGIDKSFSKQFQEVTKAPTEDISRQDSYEVSQLSAKNKKAITEKSFSELNKLSDLKATQDIKPEIAEKTVQSFTDPDAGLKKLAKQKENQQKELQSKLIGQSKEGVVKTLVSGMGMATMSKWLKRMMGLKKDIEEGELEELGDDIQKPEIEAQETKWERGQASKTTAAKQQKLFSLNLKASLNFLRNMKNMGKKFSPAMLIYEDETGYIDTKETLNTLGWQDITQVNRMLYKEITNENLQKMADSEDILKKAKKDGLEVYKGNHPVFEKDTAMIAVEKLTGEVAIINDINDLQKLSIEDGAMKTEQVAG